MKILNVVDHPSEKHEISLQELGDVADGSVDLLSINNLLDKVTPDQRDILLSNVIRKVKYGGTISLNGIDLTTVVFKLSIKSINLVKANDLLYKDNKSIGTIEDTIQKLENNKLIIIRRNISDKRCEYNVEAKRAGP